MSIFDIFSNGSIGSVIDSLTNQGRSMGASFGNGDPIGSVLDSLSGKARSAANDFTNTASAPGGLGSLFGAGALGALFGNMASGSLLKNAALIGAGAVAWNFLRKWADNKNTQEEEQPYGAAPTANVNQNALPDKNDPTVRLVARAMIYAARADGNIDADEQRRIEMILSSILPAENLQQMMASISHETIDPARIVADVRSPEQADDVYRLSCSAIDIDHFMEKGYLQNLGESLGLDAARRSQIEREAAEARKQLDAAARAAN